MLATLYLEEGIQTDKAMVLAAQALGMVKKPQWEDLYLRALVAHQERAPDFPDIAERLRSLTPAALLSRVDTYLPAAPNLRPA